MRCLIKGIDVRIVEPYPIERDSLISKLMFDSRENVQAERNRESNMRDFFMRGNFRDVMPAEFKEFFYIPQFREFRYDGSPGDGGFNQDEILVLGYNLSKRLAKMKSPSVAKNKDKELFNEIVENVRDLLDLPDLEIEFHDEGNGKVRTILAVEGLRRNLEDYGTGIHQLVILCFALSLRENTNVGIEEPELFLHPGLQRKFYRFLLEKTNNTYFITTHSNVFLDAISTEETQVFHVRRENRVSYVRLIETTSSTYSVLDDMQYHASDIMQSNGIVWVEGPTDRLYILKWLSFVAPELKEGVDFSIMFYGGSNINSLTLDPDSAPDEFISLLRMNRNTVVILDSDRKAKGKQPVKAKRDLYKRLEKEIGSSGMLWRTQGREIENYVSQKALERFCSNKWGKYSLIYDSYVKFDDMIKWGKTRRKVFNYSSKKVHYTKQILDHIEKSDYEVLDLKQKLRELVRLIKQWNPSNHTLH